MKFMCCTVECIKTSLARFYVTRSACKQVLYGYFSTKPEAYIRIIKRANEVVESSVFFRGSLQLMTLFLSTFSFFFTALSKKVACYYPQLISLYMFCY